MLLLVHVQLLVNRCTVLILNSCFSFLCLTGGLGDKYCRSKIKAGFLKGDTSVRLSFLLLEKLLYHSMNLTVAWHKTSTQGLTIKILKPHLCNKKANNLIFFFLNVDFLLPGCRNLNFIPLYLYVIPLYFPTYKPFPA